MVNKQHIDQRKVLRTSKRDTRIGYPVKYHLKHWAKVKRKRKTFAHRVPIHASVWTQLERHWRLVVSHDLFHRLLDGTHLRIGQPKQLLDALQTSNSNKPCRLATALRHRSDF